MTADPDSLGALLSGLIRDVPDFPEPGVVFKDISPLLADPHGFRTVVSELAEVGRDSSGAATVNKVVGIEARGFILAAPVALALNAGFVAVRKAGKLPRATHQESYDLEYGHATLEVHRDALASGDRVLVIDDVLATGGTITATRKLIERCGATVRGVAVLIELGSMSGREALSPHQVSALMTVQ
ncbi:MAG: adenine phosphoribosyltransferase [Nocardioidaceae bacterium]